MYYDGLGVPQDYTQALVWLAKAAALGHVEAKENVGLMWINRVGYPKNDSQPELTWFTTIASAGFEYAQNTLGDMYANGKDAPHDDKQAVIWYTRAAEQGLAEAQFNLGYMFENGRGTNKDEQQAIFWYTKAASNISTGGGDGYADAQFKLANYYSRQGDVRDEHKAEYWYLKLAKDTNAAEAQYALGDLYTNGQYVKNERQAKYWFARAAAQGHVKAQDFLGLTYQKEAWPVGDTRKMAAYAQYVVGVMSSDREAIYWFTKAASAGSVEAQSVLGDLYATGREVAQDGTQADYRRAKAVQQNKAIAQNQEPIQSQNRTFGSLAGIAKQRKALAQYRLGIRHYYGRGVSVNKSRAVYWLRRSSQLGNADAQYNLGFMYATGQGVTKSLGKAYFWWAIASSQRHEKAKKWFDIVQQLIPEKQKENIRKDLKVWEEKSQ